MTEKKKKKRDDGFLFKSDHAGIVLLQSYCICPLFLFWNVVCQHAHTMWMGWFVRTANDQAQAAFMLCLDGNKGAEFWYRLVSFGLEMS